MKIVVVCILLCIYAQLYGQDLIAPQAPIDRKMRSTSEVDAFDRPTDVTNNIDKKHYTIIRGIIVVDNNEGWEWLDDEKGQYIEEYYPIEVRYKKYDFHPHYRVVKDDVFDDKGKLIRAAHFVHDDMDFLVSELLRQTYITDYRNNKYNFKKEDAKSQNFVKRQLGLLPDNLSFLWSDKAINYLRQLEVDHEDDFKYLLKCERLDNLSFKVTYGDENGNATSSWKVSFSTYKKYEAAFGVNKMPTEQIDWSLYDIPSDEEADLYNRFDSHFHKVKKGETLQSIARKRHTTIEDLCKLNHIGKNVQLMPGQILKYRPSQVDSEQCYNISKDETNQQSIQAEVSELEYEKNLNDKRTEVDVNKIYDVVDEMPQFIGGEVTIKSRTTGTDSIVVVGKGANGLLEYTRQSLRYPVIAEENGVQGRVVVTFVIDADGAIIDPKVIKSVDPTLDKEAVRIIKAMPKWTPGRKNGIAVKVKYTIPVTFRLQ